MTPGIRPYARCQLPLPLWSLLLALQLLTCDRLVDRLPVPAEDASPASYLPLTL